MLHHLNYRLLTGRSLTGIGLVVLAAIALLWRLGNGSLEDWDEAIYAQVSKEILETGDWLTLHWEYKLWFHKPPLLMWITALFFQLFGLHEFWARLASSLCGIGLVWMTWRLAVYLYGAVEGIAAALILLTSLQFMSSARFGTIDAMLTLFLYIALYAYMRVLDGAPKFWYLVWGGIGLAMMAKGVAAVVIFPALLISLVLSRYLLKALRSPHFWGGVGLAALIVLPWHIAMVWIHGAKFLGEYIGYHVLARSGSALEGHTGNAFYYIDRLYKYCFPWVFLVPFAFFKVGLDHWQPVEQERSAWQLRREHVLVLFAVVVWCFYTLIQTKLRWYILPMYPALAVLNGDVVVQAIKQSGWRVSSVGVAVAGAGIMWRYSWPIAIALGLVGLVLLWASQRFQGQTKWQAIAPVLSASCCLLLLVVGLKEVRPVYQKQVSPMAVLAHTATVAGLAPSSQPRLIVYGTLSEPAALFYSDRPIESAYDNQGLRQWLSPLPLSGQDMIFFKTDLEVLKQEYDVAIIRESDPLMYGTVKLKG